MSRPKPLSDPFPDRPFSVRAARAAGVTASRLRGSDLATPFRGSRIPSDDGDVLTAALAYKARAPRGHVFTHLTAARLLGLRMPESQLSNVLDVGAVHPARAPKSQSVRRHELLGRSRIVMLRSGLLVTDPVETWISLGRVLSLDGLVIMGDGLVRRTSPLATIEQLAEAVADARRRPGVKKLSAALELIRPRTDSARESMLRLVIVRAGLPEPEVNGEIRDSAGNFVALGDLFYRRHKVLVEYDGGGHFTQEQFDKDIDRLDDIMALDVRVIRVNKALMRTPDRIFAKITEALSTHRPVR